MYSTQALNIHFQPSIFDFDLKKVHAAVGHISLNVGEGSSLPFMYFLSEEEIEEIAFRLELSQANFIWALRCPKGEERRLEEILPDGIESGVPIVAKPMAFEQNLNGGLLVENDVAMEVMRESLKPDLVIYDKAFARFSVSPLYTFPSVWLHIVSAASLSYTFHLTSNSGTEYPFLAIYLRDFELRRLLTAIGRNALDACDDSPIPLLVNTCRAMEGKYLDHHASSTNLKVLPVGPLIPSSPNSTGESGDDDIELMNWLGQKSEHSTVFASFGTMYFLSKEEIKEIAFSLELSNVNFIWALGSPKGEERRLEEILPEGFLGRVKDKGRIVQGWLPQPITGRVLVENGVAIEVVRDENGRLQREEMAKVIKEVVFGGAGETMRQKIKDLRKKIKSEEKENLDGLLTLIIQLSKKNSSHGINIARA
ncbi:beta-D-glucosyl crocetin beta-1,6-glucosyltransferase-like [Coffea eugenioides]|uniref:beta-D-glucosyl crocetin beta-1,6-glucosyltransferase-like n=1 Tax=Coffea eugenioides TaxID=49369 RepID=UPI000F60F5F8|nr:beta-D-glucosyl crocetin beta-1,6-glucosyltransferase-like [Coffea eugenioides]